MTYSQKVSSNLTSRQTVELPKQLSDLAHVELANSPTPLQEALRFSDVLGGSRVFIKRDDLTGLGTGGNKTRKLEYLIGDALEKGADSIVTAGAVQSNHCRQTAAAAAQCGLECHLVLGGKPPERPAGNFLLDELFGAKFHWTERRLRNRKIEEVTRDLKRSGKHPYAIPIGGSNHIGAMGYVAAMFELKEQLLKASVKIDRIVFATSSGGTQAGLVLGAALTGFTGAITGISIDQVPDKESDEKYQAFVLDIANSAARTLKINQVFDPGDIDINYDYLGKGYGVVGDLEREAIKTLARTEGIVVGPVYTGRALGALMDLVRRGAFGRDESILFWHTGDDVAVHAYVDEILQEGV